MFRANGSMLGVKLVMNMLVLMISLIVLFVFVQVPSFLLQHIVERPRNQRLRRREKQLESLWIDIHTERDVLPEDLLLHEGQTHAKRSSSGARSEYHALGTESLMSASCDVCRTTEGSFGQP